MMNFIFFILFFSNVTYSLGDIESLEECGLIIVYMEQEITEELEEYLNSLDDVQVERLIPETLKDDVIVRSPNESRRDKQK